MSMNVGPLQIADGIYHVGARELQNELQCNAYLIIDNQEAILIDPGSVIDFDYVFRNIEQIIDPHLISGFILQHQDPDLCSSVPLFESKGLVRQIITHWRTGVLLKYYGIRADYYFVDHHNYTLALSSGRILRFIATPYLHFPGAITTYDAQSETLFSSDLFGAFFINEKLQRVFADEQYIEAMKAFHEHYMPGNELLRPIMERFLTMQVRRIAPQHGSIICDRIPEHIKALRDLECGSYLNTIKKEIAKEGGYVAVCNEILRRCHAIAGLPETIATFNDTDIVLDEATGYIIDFSTSGEQLWHNVFRIIQQRQGIGWLSALEMLTRRITVEYGIPMPDVFESTLSNITQQVVDIDKKYQNARVHTERLQKKIEETREQLLHDPTSGLYNAPFFTRYLQNELSQTGSKRGAFMLISIDNLQRINYKYGAVQGDTTVKNCAWLINEHALEAMVIARLEGAIIGVYLPGYDIDNAVQWAESLRVRVANSTVFIEPLTVSIGLIHTTELPEKELSVSEAIQLLHRTAGIRVRIAKKRGANYVCKTSTIGVGAYEDEEKTGKVLVVDTEKVNVDIIATMLSQMDLQVRSATDGEEALEKITTFAPDIVIAEMMLPKVDGFSLREQLLTSSHMKTIPFILMSHVKNEATVERAHRLDIVHYFKKPYLLSELVGIVKKVLRNQDLQ